MHRLHPGEGRHHAGLPLLAATLFRQRWGFGLPSCNMRAAFNTLRAVGICCLMAPASLLAQERPKVVLYKDWLAAHFDTVAVMKNVIKANPLLFFRGEMPLYCERALSPWLSLEVGAGVTLRNYMALSFIGDDADDFGAGTEIIPSLSYRIGTRFYLEGDLEPQGWYIQPEFGRLTYTKDILVADTVGRFTGQRLRDRRTYNDVRILGGYQALSYSSNWVFDMYGGFAFRVRELQVVTETLDPLTRTYSYAQETRNDRVPAFFLGVKVGLGF